MPHGPDRTDSFEAQLLALMPALRRYSRSLARSDADGEDLLQDSIEKALSQRGQWRGLNLRGWTLTIMTNLYRNGIRKRAGRSYVAVDEVEIAAPEAEADPLGHQKLDAALNLLPEDARAILMLVVIEGRTYEDAASILDIPIGTVMSRLSRARRKLSELMTSDNVVALRRPK